MCMAVAQSVLDKIITQLIITLCMYIYAHKKVAYNFKKLGANMMKSFPLLYNLCPNFNEARCYF